MKAKKAFFLFTLMLVSEGIFFLPFVLARIFRPTFLKVFEINNLELGAAFSVYGIVAMVSYFFGGPIADKYDPRKLMTFSLVITALSGIVMATIPSLFTLMVLYGFWGISTILLFWAASIKAIRQIGGEGDQGKSYGLVDGGRGLVAALLASASVVLLDYFLPGDPNLASLDDLSSALSNIIIIFSGVILLGALLVWRVFPQNTQDTLRSSQKLTLSGMKEVIKRRSVWLQALILLCGYVGYKSLDDISLYGSVVLGYDDVEAAYLGTVSFWTRPFAAVAAGLLGDRYGHSKMTGLCFVMLILGSIVISTGVLTPGMEVIIVMTVICTGAGIYGLRGLYFALFQESKIPLVYTGSAVGFISVIGYTPDVFMGPLMGVLLDNNPGELGHQYLFGLLAVFGLIGLIASYLFHRSVV